MKINCDALGDWIKRKLDQLWTWNWRRKAIAREKRQNKLYELQEWHDFYAIWPRKLSHGDCRLFEKIQRCGQQYTVYNSWGCYKGKKMKWFYRAPRTP